MVLELYKHTFGADEFFIQTLCWNSRFRNSVYDLNDEYNGCQRLIDWDAAGRTLGKKKITTN